MWLFDRRKVLVTFAVALLAACNRAPALEGMWAATVTVGSNRTRVPFQYLISGQGMELEGSFFNGNEKITSTTVQIDKNKIVFTYPEYGSRLEVVSANNALEGSYFLPSGAVYDFEARRYEPVRSAGAVPSIGGLWTIEVPTTKDERAWHLIINQSGPDVTASILRVDGDSGAVTGIYDGSKFVLGHFSGARPLRLELLPQADGTLTVEQDSWYTYTARRADEALAKGLPQPADPSRYSRVKDPGARFEFSFPDIENHLVTNTDARFSRKVVIVTIGGSWCPNCHDEAPFLMELYRTYRDRGLEIVFLSFEEAEQLKGLGQLRAFIKRYDVEYPVLIAGDTRLVRLRLPQVVNLEAFPTTLFLGRDGLVREVHAGFAGAATGRYHTSLKAEMTATIERLLEER
jgi:thiol-disulfide isomerase/thioredoxin